MSEEVGAKRWYAVHTYSGYENKEVIGNVYENPELLEGTE